MILDLTRDGHGRAEGRCAACGPVGVPELRDTEIDFPILGQRVGLFDRAAKSSARAGHSEHQLGTTIDFRSYGGSAPWYYRDWGTTKAGAWLKLNAWKYGFVMSYPKGKTSVTCYAYEPWHFRYVGRAVAAKIHASRPDAARIPVAPADDPTPTPTPDTDADADADTDAHADTARPTPTPTRPRRRSRPRRPTPTPTPTPTPDADADAPHSDSDPTTSDATRLTHPFPRPVPFADAHPNECRDPALPARRRPPRGPSRASRRSVL